MNRGWHTIAVVASGPSLDADQAATITAAQAAGRCRVIVVNETWQQIPAADVLYAADAAWWSLRIGDVRAGFSGELWTQQEGLVRLAGGKREPWEDAAPRLGVNVIRSVAGAGVHPDPDAVYRGGNSGHQAICLARLFGARRIVLAGFDMQRTAGRSHWHGDHVGLANGNPASFVPHFEKLAPELAAEGIECINASRATALTCFPRATLADALASHVEMA